MDGESIILSYASHGGMNVRRGTYLSAVWTVDSLLTTRLVISVLKPLQNRFSAKSAISISRKQIALLSTFAKHRKQTKIQAQNKDEQVQKKGFESVRRGLRMTGGGRKSSSFPLDSRRSSLCLESKTKKEERVRARRLRSLWPSASESSSSMSGLMAI